MRIGVVLLALGCDRSSSYVPPSSADGAERRDGGGVDARRDRPGDEAGADARDGAARDAGPDGEATDGPAPERAGRADAGPDAAPDAMPAPDLGGPLPETSVGDPCGHQSDCPGLERDGDCLFPKRGWPDGFCTRECDQDADCPGAPEAAVCVPFADLFEDVPVGRCLPVCRHRVECREGYACLDTGLLGLGRADPVSVCLPWCVDEGDCPGGRPCVTAPDRDNRVCETPDAVVGDPCRTGWDCRAEHVCMSERVFGYPRGRCSIDHCDGDGDCPMALAGVPSRCVEIGGSSGECHPSCEDAGDCAAGYACASCGEGGLGCSGRACMPACANDGDCAELSCAPSGWCTGPWEPDNEGRRCEEPADCPGGFCRYDTPGADGTCLRERP